LLAFSPFFNHFNPYHAEDKLSTGFNQFCASRTVVRSSIFNDILVLKNEHHYQILL
jgi:hypothetical protein